jgi:hypothetical protein
LHMVGKPVKIKYHFMIAHPAPRHLLALIGVTK